MAKKRRTSGGRVTPSKRARAAAAEDQGAGRGEPRSATVEPSGRYTPPARTSYRYRPAWHKAIGVLAIVAGLTLFFVCQFNGWGIHDYGGHIWYLVGLTIAGSSLWWFGAFDRTPPPIRSG